MGTNETLRERLAAYNEVGQLYVVAGIITGAVALFVPIIGLIPLYCGYRLFRADHSRFAGVVIGGVGLVILLDLALSMLAVV